jgi:hypothetical protein
MRFPHRASVAQYARLPAAHSPIPVFLENLLFSIRIQLGALAPARRYESVRASPIAPLPMDWPVAEQV